MSGLISVDDARRALAPHALDAGEETIGINDALGRILTRDVLAGTTAPPADVSAMDGYAVRLADTKDTGSQLRVTGEIPAGTLPAHAIGPGEAMRIFTGAPLPEGADHILIGREGGIERDFALLRDAERTAMDLRQAVTSPGGTTAAALSVLMGEGGFGDLLPKALDACVKRSEELGG